MASHVLAFAIGAVVAVLWTRLVLACEARQAGRAFFLDLTLMLVGASAYQLWDWTGREFSIFAAEALGSAIATGLTVWRAR